MNDKEFQKKNLQEIFNTANMSPCFKENPKFLVNGVPRIAYDDVMNWRYIIRLDENFGDNRFWSDNNAKEIVRYSTIDDLVNDGWRLD